MREKEERTKRGGKKHGTGSSNPVCRAQILSKNTLSQKKNTNININRLVSRICAEGIHFLQEIVLVIGNGTFCCSSFVTSFKIGNSDKCKSQK